MNFSFTYNPQWSGFRFKEQTCRYIFAFRVAESSETKAESEKNPLRNVMGFEPLERRPLLSKEEAEEKVRNLIRVGRYTVVRAYAKHDHSKELDLAFVVVGKR